MRSLYFEITLYVKHFSAVPDVPENLITRTNKKKESKNRKKNDKQKDPANNSEQKKNGEEKAERNEDTNVKEEVLGGSGNVEIKSDLRISKVSIT